MSYMITMLVIAPIKVIGDPLIHWIAGRIDQFHFPEMKYTKEVVLSEKLHKPMPRFGR